MAKRVCEDWADMIFNEKLEITLLDKRMQEIVDGVLDKNNFRVCANRLVELSFALGTGAFVEHKTKDGVLIDYVKADMIYPLSFSNGKITECAFASRMLIYGEMHTYLNIHVLSHTYLKRKKIFSEYYIYI